MPDGVRAAVGGVETSFCVSFEGSSLSGEKSSRFRTCVLAKLLADSLTLNHRWNVVLPRMLNLFVCPIFDGYGESRED